MRFVLKSFSLLANDVCMFVELEQKEKASKGILILELFWSHGSKDKVQLVGFI